MIRIQIYLTEKEQNARRTIADLESATQSELIHEAIDKYIVAYQQSNYVQLLRKARGIWSYRKDVDAHELRVEWDRRPEQQV